MYHTINEQGDEVPAIFRYLRKGRTAPLNRKREKGESRGVPYGVLTAVKEVDGTLRYGWSLCHRSDQFSKDYGRFAALDRAFDEPGEALVPRDVATALPAWEEQAEKFFAPRTQEA